MNDQNDDSSDHVSALIREAEGLLSEAEGIFKNETTDEHRTQWPNVYKLEDATRKAQLVLALAERDKISEATAEELVGAAAQARDTIREAVTTGGGSLIDAAERLFAATSRMESEIGTPLGPAAVRELREEIERTRDEIKIRIGEAAAEVAGQKDQAFDEMKEATEDVEERREAANQQARELGQVTGTIAALNLAEAYAPVAKSTEKEARVYTIASLVVAVLALAATVIGLLKLEEGSEFHTVIAHAAYGLPGVFLAAYVNRLASTHRREAWRLRHIELQIKTANPFLGLLNTERREQTLAALALRFFPGQESVSFDGKGAAEPTPELIDLLRTLLLQQQGAGVAAMRVPNPPTVT